MTDYKFKWNIIVAYDKKRGIGAENDLLWMRDLPADLAHFKQITTGHTVIMGRRTYESIGRPLPNRQNIVVSRSPINAEGIIWASNLEEAHELSGEDAPFIIGGAQMYREALSKAARIYATEVDATFEKADVFFPEFDTTKSPSWKEVERSTHLKDAKNKYNYDFVEYEHTTRVKL